MAIQLSTSVRNARLDAIETDIGTLPKLRIFTGSAPANCAAAETGTKLAEMDLPSDWMAVASAGVKGKAGTWEDLIADATGTATYFRIVDSTAAATHCELQGTCGIGSGDLQLDNTSIAAGQSITVTQFDLTDANA